MEGKGGGDEKYGLYIYPYLVVWEARGAVLVHHDVLARSGKRCCRLRPEWRCLADLELNEVHCE